MAIKRYFILWRWHSWLSNQKPQSISSTCKTTNKTSYKVVFYDLKDNLKGYEPLFQIQIRKPNYDRRVISAMNRGFGSETWYRISMITPVKIWPLGLNNFWAWVRSHGSRRRERPRHHNKSRELKLEAFLKRFVWRPSYGKRVASNWKTVERNFNSISFDHWPAHKFLYTGGQRLYNWWTKRVNTTWFIQCRVQAQLFKLPSNVLVKPSQSTLACFSCSCSNPKIQL